MLLLKSYASVDRSIVPPPEKEGSYLYYFHYASGFCTQILAYTLDSLVRVSRRVEENHFVNISNPLKGYQRMQGPDAKADFSPPA